MIFFISTSSLFACDANLLRMLSNSADTSSNFTQLIAGVASNTKYLSDILTDFLEKNQKVSFPPKKINGIFVGSYIDTKSKASDIFVKLFTQRISVIANLWAQLMNNTAKYPEWVKKDSNWEHKCKIIEDCMASISDDIQNKKFFFLHDPISLMYGKTLSLLEMAQTDRLNKILLSTTGDVVLLIHGVESNSLNDIGEAAKKLASNTTLLAKVVPASKVAVISHFIVLVKDLNNVFETSKNHSKFIELSGAIEHELSLITEKFQVQNAK